LPEPADARHCRRSRHRDAVRRIRRSPTPLVQVGSGCARPSSGLTGLVDVAGGPDRARSWCAGSWRASSCAGRTRSTRRCDRPLTPVAGTPRSPTDAGVGQPIHRSGVAGIRQSVTAVGAGRIPVQRQAHGASIDGDTSNRGRSGGRERPARPTSRRTHENAGKAPPGLRRSLTR
jgi:hypothetical protein